MHGQKVKTGFSDLMMILKNMMHSCRLKQPTVYKAVKMSTTLNMSGCKIQNDGRGNFV